jgi:hypothetical protein
MNYSHIIRCKIGIYGIENTLRYTHLSSCNTLTLSQSISYERFYTWMYIISYGLLRVTRYGTEKKGD